jgi:hypothetical protein
MRLALGLLLLVSTQASAKKKAVKKNSNPPCVEKIGKDSYKEPDTLKELLTCQRARRVKFYKKKKISNGQRVRFSEEQRAIVDSYLRRHPQQAASTKEPPEKKNVKKKNTKKSRKGRKKRRAKKRRQAAPKIDLQAPSLDGEMDDLFKE